MPRLLKSVEGNVNETIQGDIKVIKYVLGQAGEGDYFKIYGITAFLQDFTNTYEYTIYQPLRYYGVYRENNNVIELNISY